MLAVLIVAAVEHRTRSCNCSLHNAHTTLPVFTQRGTLAVPVMDLQRLTIGS